MGNTLKGVDAERAFIAWYQQTDRERHVHVEEAVTHLRMEVETEQKAIDEILHSWSLLDLAKRVTMGNRQQLHRQKKAKLEREQKKLDRILSPETAQAVFKRARAVPRVRALHVAPAMRWIVHTEALYSFNKDNQTWHKLGRYKIYINLIDPDPNAIKWRNKTFGPLGGTQQNPNRYEAPQIRTPGTVHCLGTADTAMRKAYENRAYDTLVSVALRFAECAPTSMVTLWPQVRKDEVPQWYLDNALNW